MKARCLSTRSTPEGFRRRRYETSDGLRFSTIEVPTVVWNYLNRQGSAKNRAAQAFRAMARANLRMKARALAALPGWRTLAIASELDVPVRTVQRWLAKPR